MLNGARAFRVKVCGLCGRHVGKVEDGLLDLRVDASLNHGYQLVPEPVSAIVDGPIRRVKPGRDGRSAAVGAGHGTRDRKQWPDDLAVAPRHGSQTPDTGASKDVQQDRLDPVIGSVSEGDGVGSDLDSASLQELAPLDAGRFLCGAPGAHGGRRDIGVADDQRNGQGVRQVSNEALIPIRSPSSKHVVQMRSMKPEIQLTAKACESMHERARVLPAREPDDQGLPVREQAVHRNGRSQCCKERVRHAGIIGLGSPYCQGGEMEGLMSEKQAKGGGGLEDVIAGESAICLVDGPNGRLVYRGYDVAQLAESSTFEEVAYLLWYGRLPGRIEFDAFLDTFTGSMRLPIETAMILRMFPKAATPMEVLRTAVSSLGHWDPDSGNTGLDACLRKAIRITERLPLLVTAHERLRNGLEPLQPVPGRSIAHNFLYTLFGTDPDPVMVTAFDVALILHADHELNASTFAARVVAATMSDMYSAVTAAIGALKGPLHGGANEQAVAMFREIGDPSKAEEWIDRALASRKKVPGFGHRVYRTDDPRAVILKEYARSVSKQAGDTRLFEIGCEVERVMRERTHVFPNVDLWSGICYSAMDIPIELFTPIFAISRIVGWTAHILEQWSNNRLIRPRAQYIGPTDLTYIPINRR